MSSPRCPPPISTQLHLLTRVFFILRAVVIGIATNHYIPDAVLQLVVTKALLFKCPTANNQKHYAWRPCRPCDIGKLAVSVVGLAKHSLLKFHYQLGFHFIFNDKDSCLIKCHNLYCCILQQ